MLHITVFGCPVCVMSLKKFKDEVGIEKSTETRNDGITA